MPGSPLTPKGAFEIRVEEEAWQGLSSLSEAAQAKVTELWATHLQHTPTKRIPGKLKELRGDYKGHYQYEVNRSDRMIYRVDEGAKVVYVEYIGKHPDWRRRRRRSF